MQKGVCKCVFLGRAINFFGPSLGGGDRPLAPRTWIRHCGSVIDARGLHSFVTGKIAAKRQTAVIVFTQ